MADYDEMWIAEEPETKKPEIRKKTIIISVSVLTVLFLLGYYIFSCMLGYTAHSRYETLRADAQSVYKAAEMWLEEGNTLTTHEARMDRQEDAFSEYLQQYFSKQNGWYVIVCDADGNLNYVLFSRKRIKENRMHIPDKDEEMKRLRSPLWHTYAVGCYPEE